MAITFEPQMLAWKANRRFGKGDFYFDFFKDRNKKLPLAV